MPRTLSQFISQRALAVDASGIRKVFDLAAKMKDPINFSIGQPDFDVPEPAKDAAVRAMQAGNNRYTQTQGIAELRTRLRAELQQEFGQDLGEPLITSGVSGGLFLAILSCIDPGDEVLFLDPYFVMYRHLVTLAGGKPVAVDSYPDFRFHADRVEAAITPRTKLMILNSPSNPTGAVMSRAEVDAAIGLAKKHDLLLLSDEIYEPFLYEGSGQRRHEGTEAPRHGGTEAPRHEGQSDGRAIAFGLRWGAVAPQTPISAPLARGDTGKMPVPRFKGDCPQSDGARHSALPSPVGRYDKTILLRGFSKSHAMTGWRLGYAAGPEAILQQMTKLQQYTFVCAPAPFQYGALAALDLPMDHATRAYQQKRDIVYESLRGTFDVVKPQGAFYIFPRAPKRYASASEFCTKAIENNVLIIPGNVFSGRDTHFRISYATTEAKLREGCEILCGLAK